LHHHHHHHYYYYYYYYYHHPSLPEPHLQQLVRLIQYQCLNTLQMLCQITILQMINQTTRCRSQKITPLLLEPPLLTGNVSTSIKTLHTIRMVVGEEGTGLGGDLLGEFTCGGDDEDGDMAFVGEGRRRGPAEGFDRWDEESHGLSCACLGTGDHIFAFHDGW